MDSYSLEFVLIQEALKPKPWINYLIFFKWVFIETSDKLKKKNQEKYECAYMIFGLLLHYALGHYTFAVWSVSSICKACTFATYKHHHDLVQVGVCSKKS